MPITREEVSFTLDLTEELERVPRSKRKEVKEKIGNLLLESIKEDAMAQRSSVSGQKWKGLSKEYKKFKEKKGKGSSANLTLFGDMLSNLSVKNTSDGIKIEQKGGQRQRDKAFNHNTGDTLAQRQFLPDDGLGQTFRSGVMSEVKSILKEEQTLPEQEELTTEQRQLERSLLEELRLELSPTVETRLGPRNGG